MRRLLILALLLNPLWFQAPSALASGEMCVDSPELDKYRLLRRLSLDLRTRVPSLQEYESLHDEEDVPAQLVEEWLASYAFRLAMRSFHASLLWPNPGTVQFNSTSANLATFTSQGQAIIDIIALSRRNQWRSNNQGLHCANVDQATLGYEADGRPKTQAFEYSPGQFAELEGWVEVSPYWDPDSTVKVCAFVAMEHAEGAKGACDFPTAASDAGCGCGPNLRWCYGPGVEKTIKAQMTEQVHRLIDTLSTGAGVDGVRPYSDLIRTSRVWSNGALDFFDKYLGKLFNLNRTMDISGPGDRPIVGEPNFADDTWVESERGWPHAGVQTLAAYTLRFNTNRARQNRFRIAFTNQYYVPPTQSDMTGCTEDAADITERCVCRDCHVVVEPLSAYWAFHAEDGSGPLTNTDFFPEILEECQLDLDTLPIVLRALCNRFYVTEDAEGTVRRGWLRPLQYAIEGSDNVLHSQIHQNAYAGPGAWAEQIVENGIFQQTMVQNLWRYLMGRDMNLDLADPDNELGVLAELAAELQEHDSLPELVRSIVNQPAYRRAR